MVDATLRNLCKNFDLSGMAITAAIRADGTLHRVGGEFAKLLAAARERALPRIHTVLVAADQDLTSTGMV